MNRINSDSATQASAVLARAFIDDPAYIHMEPDTQRRAMFLEVLYLHLVRALHPLGETCAIGDDAMAVSGVACWWPPAKPRKV